MGLLQFGFIDLIVAVFVSSMVVWPMATLAHELGHAALALRFSADPVIVQVGRPPAMVELAGDRLAVRWSLLPSRGVPFAGMCLWDITYATDLERMAVSLAGPLVTAMLVPLFLWATIMSAGSPSWITATWLVSANIALIAFLTCIDPRMTDEERADGVFRDGPTARAAFRAWRGP